MASAGSETAISSIVPLWQLMEFFALQSTSTIIRRYAVFNLCSDSFVRCSEGVMWKAAVLGYLVVVLHNVWGLESSRHLESWTEIAG